MRFVARSLSTMAFYHDLDQVILPNRVERLSAVFLFLWGLLTLAGRIGFLMLCSATKWVVPKKRKSLAGEIVLITGSAQGLGRLLALKAAQMGAKVVLWDIIEDKLRHVAQEIAEKGGEAKWYVCDVSSEVDVNVTASLVQRDVGYVQILINNAAVLQNESFEDLESSKIRQTLEVNVLGCFWTMRAFLPRMKELNRGHLVTISSAGGLMGHVNHSDYCASKFGVTGLMESLSEEMRLKNSDIRFTTICPVTIDTGMNRNPQARHPIITPILNVENVADEVLDAVRREDFLVVIPKRLELILCIHRFLPRIIITEILDFLQYCRWPNSAANIHLKE